MDEPVFLTQEEDRIPGVSREQMERIDQLAMEEYRIDLLSMMENAGRGLAHVIRGHNENIRRGEEGTDFPESAVILAGGGNNGGGGLVAARHLANRGVDISIVLDRSPSDLDGAVAQHTETAFALDCPVHRVPESDAKSTLQPVLEDADLLVDAIVGYGLDGPLRGPAKTLVSVVNSVDRPIVSLDVPTGLDATTGEVLGSVVDTDVVVTLALPKLGLESVAATLFLVDIGLPPALYDHLSLDYRNPFDSDTVRLTTEGR